MAEKRCPLPPNGIQYWYPSKPKFAALQSHADSRTRSAFGISMSLLSRKWGQPSQNAAPESNISIVETLLLCQRKGSCTYDPDALTINFPSFVELINLSPAFQMS
jgi:hypothetical protein